ncbi:c-type cytochrome [Acidovorax sp. Root70]|uniref:c-type cytochrome n=1 Tax=Acidovorax sp. Root70 TaxID=1736590 RepID=UPI0006F6A2EE|nr:c-type cytochrome [Acidovorax sp. Root70]KRB28009.1 cytochrome C [Acidovorax sp. Root70]
MTDCLRSLLRPVLCLPAAAALLALALSAGAVAQTVPASTTSATPVATASTAAAVPVSSMSSRALACTACHGKEGRATPDGYFPRIAGKPAGYLANQLLNFRDGRRSYPQMGYLIEHLTDDYLREMAGHFAALDLPYPPPPPPQAPPAVLEQGRRLVQVGDAARNIPACVACHGAAMTGVVPSIPGLLGLPRDYLNSQLGAWKTGQRRAHRPDCMADIARQLTPDDVSAVSAWLAAQPVAAGGKPARTLPAAMPARCGGVAEVPVAAAAAR